MTRSCFVPAAPEGPYSLGTGVESHICPPTSFKTPRTRPGAYLKPPFRPHTGPDLFRPPPSTHAAGPRQNPGMTGADMRIFLELGIPGSFKGTMCDYRKKCHVYQPLHRRHTDTHTLTGACREGSDVAVAFGTCHHFWAERQLAQKAALNHCSV